MPTTSELLSIAVERSAYINTYWNLLIAVATGVLGILASGKELAGRRDLRVVLACVFSVFAVSNLSAILDLNRQRAAVCALITEPSLRQLVAELRPLASWKYGAFHAVLDVLVVLCIALVPWTSEARKSRSPQ